MRTSTALPATSSPRLKPLQGSARGRILKAMLTERIGRLGICQLSDVLRDFNSRYTPPMPNTNASAALLQLVRSGEVTKLAQDFYAGPAGDGALLPRLKQVNPKAYGVYQVLDAGYPNPTLTRDIPTLYHRMTGSTLTQQQMYTALHFLKDQGVCRWDKVHANVSKLHVRPSPLLGGGYALDVINSADPNAKFNDAPIDKYNQSIKLRRDEHDNVVDPLAESLDGETVDVFA